MTRVCLTQRLADALQRSRKADALRALPEGRSGPDSFGTAHGRVDVTQGVLKKKGVAASRALHGDAGGTPPIRFHVRTGMHSALSRCQKVRQSVAVRPTNY